MIETTHPVTQSLETAARSEIKATAAAAVKKERFFYIDNLRLLMIIFVVILHAAVTYSGLGSWYYKEERELGAISMFLFALFQVFTQAYFMGILFLVAGYFVPAAYDKKGFSRFMIDRMIRLGIPSLIYMLVIHPFNVYVLLDLSWVRPKPGFWTYYSHYITSLDFVGSSGPLWFAVALLIFSLGYALYRLVNRKNSNAVSESPITTQKVLLLVGLISVLAFSIRLVQPIGTSILNMQLAYFAQYIVLFIIGIQAYRNNWLARIRAGFGKRWLWVGLIACPITFIALLVGGGAVDNGFDAYIGGWYWQSAAFALWESLTAVAMSIGLLTLLREKANKQNRLVKILSDNAFAVYVFHAPVLISISLLLQPVVLAPLAKFALVAAIAVTACFALTFFILRRIPLLKKVI